MSQVGYGPILGGVRGMG